MKFFKPEDFERQCHPEMGNVLDTWQLALATTLANAKLERDAKVVYCALKDTWFSSKEQCQSHETHKALLINIEPIAPCTHEVRSYGPDKWLCARCKVLMRPTQWEACE